MEANYGGETLGQYHVVAIPYPGRGHINPMMNLCRLLAGRGLLVSFIVTEEWLQLLGGGSAAASSWPPNLRIRTIPNVIPSERTRGTDFRKFIEAIYTKMEGPTEELIEGLQPPADSILTTSLLSWAAAIADRRSIPVCLLCTESPAVFLAFHHFENPDVQLKLSATGKEHDALAYLPRTDTFLFGDAQSSTSIIRSYKKGGLSWFTKSNALLFTSFYELDRRVIDALRSQLLPLPVYPLGPSIPHMALADEPLDAADAKIYLGWLDSQPESSVVYIALGSFAPVSADQMEALANGLKLSGVRFFWAVREDAGRMQELVGGGMGLAVPWCDQLRVLSHPSVGGFLTHCGWNSVLEGVFAGVPMLTFPLVWDQFPNSRSIVDDWKIGFRLKEEAEQGGGGGGEVVVPKEDVAKMVKKLMDMECSERKRAKDLQGKCKEALGEGGSLWRNLDSFVQGLVSSKLKSTGNADADAVVL